MLEVMTLRIARRPQLERGEIQKRLEAITQPLDEPQHQDAAHEVDAPDRVDAIAEVVSGYATLQHSDGSIAARIPSSDEVGHMVLGRSEGAAIRLDDPYVHRLHATIRWDHGSGSHVIEDAGGANGTYVNGIRARSPRRLSDGVRIRLGKTEMVYRAPKRTC